ncbi:ABC transporter ATP-binding protein [Aquincola sp. S2]|uniref:Spermidine/putrescine import ATP-binding protein PotA n=1 Tax=Pseudaquabacterium terrae TaxID=2732868 RepID=A0ABX2EM29_9BURK|nr:ABC transporter ATP-binding protein [Aquabacterium terrae]NRF69709.1 ABC transporter ATP-binding protein [Aquabacterium terrae]
MNKRPASPLRVVSTDGSAAPPTAEPARDTLVQFRGVQKTYDGQTLVVRSLDLDIRRGEFLSLLGPSGSGKTTCLMMLAGFESPTAGEILLDGQPITGTPPHKRHFGMVFQNYALFPHMTVAENVAYPLTVRKLPKAEIAQRVAKALAMVQLTGRDQRHPAQLSGGQQQRVALARALVFEPQLVLMDEPLGALDKQLREHMQIELKELHRQLGVTFVYVTHDQGEALTMSDRVAVFNDGEIQQIDGVERLYETPANRFVAGFVGDSTQLAGTLGAAQGGAGGTCELVLPTGERLAGINVNGALPGANVLASVRPERIEAHLALPRDAINVLKAAVNDVIYFGDHLRLRCALAGQAQATVKLPLSAGEQPVPGQTVWLQIPPPFLRVYA